MGSQRVVHNLVTKQQLHRQLVIANSEYTLVMFFHHERLIIWAIYRVAQSRTRLKRLSSSSSRGYTEFCCIFFWFKDPSDNNKPKPYADPFPCLSGPWRALEHLQLLLVLGCRYPWWHLTTTVSPPGNKTARQQLHSSIFTLGFCWH